MHSLSIKTDMTSTFSFFICINYYMYIFICIKYYIPEYTLTYIFIKIFPFKGMLSFRKKEEKEEWDIFRYNIIIY